MLNAQIFAAADTAVALMLAAGFMIAYLVDRKLATFRWWAVFYALVALSFSTIVNHPQPTTPWAEGVAWVLLYCAVAVACFGMYHEGESKVRPHLPIVTGAVVLTVIVSVLTMRQASHAEWVLWGVVPTIGLALWSALSILLHPPLKRVDWGYTTAIVAGTVMIGVRSSWFASTQFAVRPPPGPPPAGFAPPPGAPLPPGMLPPPALPPGQLTQPLLISLATIIVMVGLAVALILRISLKAVDQMRERSSTDAMTGLLNRATFDEEAHELLRSQSGQEVGALVVDLDHFKRINDTCGHATGDHVISSLGAIIAEATQGNAIAGRIGGEEFAVLLPGANLAATRLLAEALRTKLVACDFEGSVPFPVSLSAGVATRRGGEPLHSLLARADEALYAAKNAGRNRVVVASDSPEALAGMRYA